jgi:SAM-dependent methyltransferase
MEGGRVSFDHFRHSQVRHYTESFQEQGATARGVRFKDEADQQLRFEQYLKLFDGRRRFSLNDYGCGYGALAGFLRDRVEVEYHGFDLSGPMIEHARREFGAPGFEFVEREEELSVADYTVANSIFNTKLDADPEEWKAYIVETLERMRALSRRGLAFNLLTKYSEPEKMRDDVYYADPCFFFDLCERTMSRRVVLLHDYAWEFMILVRFEDSLLPAGPASSLDR